jgi:excisionase family DNA binding protein
VVVQKFYSRIFFSLYHLSKFKNYDALPLTLTAPEVGEVLGISRAAAYELVRSKGFPRIRIGTRILVPKDKFIQWIDQQTEVDG